MKSSAGYLGFACSAVVFATALTSGLRADVGQIVSGQTYRESISAPSYMNIWRFQGQEGNRLIIAAAEVAGGIEPEILLYPPGGAFHEAVAQGDLNQYRMLDHQMQHSGEYTIIIRDWHMDETGRYDISLVTIPGEPNSTEDPDGGEIQTAATVFGTFDAQGDIDVYKFEGQTGERVVVTIAGYGQGLEPEIVLYPPGSGLREAFAGGGPSQSRTLDHVLEQTGEYTIIVNDWQMDREGDYDMSLVKIPGPATSPDDDDGGQITSGSTMFGKLGGKADTDVYQFEGQTGDRIIITAAQVYGEIEPEILLYPPDSGPMEAISLGDLYQYRRLDHQLQQSGLYTIIVRDWLMDNEELEREYDISFVRIPGPAASPSDPEGGGITSGTTVKASLGGESDTDIYNFYGRAGDRVVITAAEVSGGIEPEVFLYPPDNGPYEAFAGGDAYQYRRLDHQLQQSGVYTIVVHDWRMDSRGEYDLALAKIPGPAVSELDRDGGDIVSAMLLNSDFDGRSDTDIYRFYGHAGDRVYIIASQISGHVEPEISLYPPDSGKREGFAGGWSLENILDLNLEQSGLYTVVVNEYQMDEEGKYSLFYRRIPSTKRVGIYDPCPSNGGTVEECFTQTLEWITVGAASSYSVYFGRDITVPLAHIAENIRQPSIPWPQMERCGKYYWYVVAHTENGDITGPWWWFMNRRCELAADLNGDGTVDFFDFAIMASNWLKFIPTVDIAPPGMIDVFDLAVMADEWLQIRTGD